MTDQTRYQIMFANVEGTNRGERPIENFTAAQARQFRARVKALTAQGVKFTVWDTRRNALSKLFRF